MNYSITLYKFILEDTKRYVMYWELVTKNEKRFRFDSFVEAKKYADNLK